MLVFGAVAPGSYPAKGTQLKRGELIARIGRYPKGDTMLHFEVYKVGTTKRVRWPYGQAQPPQLVDPHPYLLATVTT
jgi:murein DD-endopeptidase MepM/ murein hydrolase activator NlpD